MRALLLLTLLALSLPIPRDALLMARCCYKCRVNAWLRARGWSDAQLAQEVGLPQYTTTLNRWRRGKTTLDGAPGLREALLTLIPEEDDKAAAGGKSDAP